MKSLEITGNIGCINQCTFCPQSLLIREYSKRSNKYEMNLEDFKIYLSKVPKDVQIDFSGMSEIFQNKNAIEMIRYADEEGYSLVFYTTLATLSKDRLLEIEDILFKSQIILHLPDNDGYTKIQIDDRYLETLNALVFLKFGSSLPIVSNTYTTVHEKIIESGIRMDILNPISLVNNDFLISRGNNLSNVKQVIKKEGNIICQNGGPNHNVLLPNGDVLLCCMSYNYTTEIIGNFLENNYEEISSKAKTMINRPNSICRFCEKSTMI